MPHSGATLEVDLSALRENYRLLKNRHAKHSIAAVVKADAYGLGAGPVAQALWEEGCRDFFVATLDEGIELRQHLSQAQIAVFHGVQPGDEGEFQQNHLMPVLNTLSQIESWSKVAPLSSAIIHVDTGMTRLGLSETELKRLPGNANPHMVISHLACANEPGDAKNTEQLTRFKTALSLFPGVKASFCNSSGLFLPAEFHFDLGRPGCALYGINPVEGKNPMEHVATLSAPFLQIRTLDRDESVGYGAAAHAKKGDRIAIVELGYADGLLRSLTHKGSAYVAGVKTPILGRVSMDMIALDVSAVPEEKLKIARAELINAEQTVSDVADMAGTIGYEIFTRMGRRVKRLYR